jgi:N-methylhydantoinase A
MQFQGQSHILTLALPQLQVAKDELQRLFEAAYWERFGVELPEIRAVLVNLHTAVIGLRPRLDLSVLARAGRAPDLKGALNGTRAVWFEGGFRDTPVYQREKLPQDANFAGPAVIEQLDCTTVIDPGNRVELDALGNLLVTV